MSSRDNRDTVSENQSPAHRGDRQVPDNEPQRNNPESSQSETIHFRDFLSQYFDQNFTDNFDSDEEFFGNPGNIEVGGVGYVNHYQRRPFPDFHNSDLDDLDNPAHDLPLPPLLPAEFPSDGQSSQLPSEDLEDFWYSHHAVNEENPKEEVSVPSSDEIDKKKDDEEKETVSTPQTSQGNIETSKREDVKKETDQSSDREDKADSEELGTIVEETEGHGNAEEKMEIQECDSCSKNEELKKTGEGNEVTTHEKRDAEMRESEGKEQATTSDVAEDVAPNVSEPQESIPPERDSKETLNIFDEYPFDESNPMKGTAKPFNDGMRALCAGNFTLAARCLELCCVNLSASEREKSPQWLCLGISQMANEQDILAIIAIKKYLAHQPDDLHCLIFLTVSYLYEDYKNLAMITLLEWLKYNPRYSDLVDISPPEEMSDVSSPMNLEFHQKLLNLYLEASNRTVRVPDADVQCALGFLFNMVQEYLKATNCFRIALSLDRYDEMLWNHLGEALVNNQRYVDSIEAFFNALNFRPKYARARYNLGVTCSNLGDYEGAMSQYIKALNIQVESSRGLVGRMSDTIWSAAKVAARFLERPDLEEAVENRDLDFLNKKFPDQESAGEEGPPKKNTICRFMRHILED